MSAYWTLRRTAKSLANELMGELNTGRLATIGADQIERACDATGDLNAQDREMLVGLTCRFVVELVFAAQQAAARP